MDQLEPLFIDAKRRYLSCVIERLDSGTHPALTTLPERKR